jgi:hypothetical protein
MTYSVARNDCLSIRSPELEFSLVLARVIGSVESDPAQLRQAVYELARIRLQQEIRQTYASISGMESRRLKLALEAAIERVEDFSSRHEESRALPSLNERSNFPPQHSSSIVQHPVVRLERSPSAMSGPHRVSTFLSSASRDSSNRARKQHWSRNAQSLIGCLAAVAGLATYLILDRQFGLFGHSPTVTPSIEVVAPTVQKADAVAAPSMIRSQSAGLPLPVAYGVYGVSGGRLNELEPLALRAPDPRVFMSAVIKTPSRTNLPDGRALFIVFRRDIATGAPDRVSVRVIAKVVRAMTFDSKGSANVAPVEDEWAIRDTSYELRVLPMNENPEMLLLQPENSDFRFPSGRYGLVLKGQVYDFTVAGPATEASHCLERTVAANGTFYSECRNP